MPGLDHRLSMKNWEWLILVFGNTAIQHVGLQLAINGASRNWAWHRKLNDVVSAFSQFLLIDVFEDPFPFIDLNILNLIIPYMRYMYPWVELRTNDFPSSLAGKGHDTAVCCRWMEHFLRSIEACPFEFKKGQLDHICLQIMPLMGGTVGLGKDCNTEILQTMLFVICNANLVFDILYGHGIFIPKNEAARAIHFAFDTGALCLHMSLKTCWSLPSWSEKVTPYTFVHSIVLRWDTVSWHPWQSLMVLSFFVWGQKYTCGLRFSSECKLMVLWPCHH